MTLRRPRPALSPEQGTDPARARSAAVALLARRDFASDELRRRLTGKGFSAAAAQAVIAQLSEEGVLNEARYAQNFVVWHVARGQGPLRIAAELRQQGVAAEFIDSALEGPHDWVQLARKVCRARFGSQPPQDWPQKARQARFLQYRGFSSDHIRAATGADPDLD